MAQEGVIVQITLFHFKILKFVNPNVYFNCNISVKSRDRKVDVSVEWPFGIWRRLFSQRQRDKSTSTYADNGIAYSCFHLFPLYFSCGPYILKKKRK